MKKSLVALAGAFAGATMLITASPAMAHDRIGFAVSVGVPVAPVAYAAPAPAYIAPPPAPVVVGGPVVTFGAPYYYGRDWRYYHGYRGSYGYRGYHGWHR